MAGRVRREFTRKGFNRDTQKLFVIAAEGTETEIKYFEEFKSPQWYHNKAVFIEPLRRIDNSSSPSRVLRQLKEFKKEYRLKDGDELWMIIDRDKQSWKISEISDVAQKCQQAKFGFAMSNPAFEFWLLLHITALTDYSEDTKREFLDNRKTGDRTRVEMELLHLLGSFNKSNINTNHFLPHLNLAIQRAEEQDNNAGERWPNQLGSHVYKLIRKLLEQN
ncbi:RloB-like protein [Chitinophaga sp. CF118]|uniref:RloB family protein n=1 Tax=Chitinophaga sp. CF118 TaxID=1884367 RepID=UPI0008F03F09|nr:RloB family protein [Chitinophaga sp. CF118]SFD54171.1 RloB-like protein [Chitinophaga sp. CF118]